MKEQLSKNKVGRLINSFTGIDKSRTGSCKPFRCKTLDGRKGNACCKLGYVCPFLNTNKNKCSVYSVRVRNCRVFPANKSDLKLVKNCSYNFK